jgi:hypothetical protein
MIWLINAHRVSWKRYVTNLEHFAKENNCTILATASVVPQWLKCSEEDLLLIKIKIPGIVLAVFTEDEFNRQLASIPTDVRKYALTKMDYLALAIRKEKYGN